MPRSQRSVSAAVVVVVVLAALLAAGRWLQPRLGGRAEAPATTRPAPTTPVPASPGSTSPTLATNRPAGPSQIRRVVATSSPVDAIATTRRAIWLAVGGLVLRVDQATERALVVPKVDAGAPVVDLAAGAGAVWAVTSINGLLRIDPDTARLTAPNPGPVSAIAAGAGGVWAVCCRGRGPRGRVTRLDPASGEVITTSGLPARPLAVAAGSGAVWVRGAEGWLWRVDRRTAGRPGPSGCQPSLAAPSWPGSWWWPVRWPGSATRDLGWCDGSTCGAGLRTAGRPMGATSR